MKTVRIIGLVAVLTVLLAGTTLAAQAPVGLGTAASFAVLAGTTITNTGPTTITGDVGLHPGSATTGFAAVTLHGAKHIADAVAKKAKQNLVTAYNSAAGRTPVTTVATELGGTTLKTGVYDTSAGTLGLTGVLTLDAEGNEDAVFIFEAASTLITAPSSSVALINGAQACNVYWRIGSSATLDTATHFQGNILALTSIALKTGARLHGRALARNGAVTLDTNVITRDDCASATTATPTSGTPAAGPTLPPTDTVAGVGSEETSNGLKWIPLVVAAFFSAGFVMMVATLHAAARPRSRR